MICPDNELDDYNDFCEIRVIPVPNALGGKRLDIVLQQLLPEFSRSRMQAWIKSGKVSIEENIANTKSRIYGGETLTIIIEPEAQALAFQAEPIDFDIIYEDACLIVVNKPVGLVVHPGSGNWTATLLNGLLFYSPALKDIPRAGIVHRLDKDTSGLMVIAKTLQAQTHLVRQLQARTVNRHYLALVDGRVAQGGIIDQPIGRHPRDRVKMAAIATGKPAKTHYTVRENFKQFTLLECKLETGRTHQIRVHMQYLGYPLAADPVYGGRPRRCPERVSQALSSFNRQALHAYRLELIHPETEEIISWEIPLAQDMQTLLEIIRDTPVDFID
jgi:23S rRNA pseudouridine1911/1915/1917 synthase